MRPLSRPANRSRSRAADWFDEGHRLIAIDVDINASTDAGGFAADAIVGVGGWERSGSPSARGTSLEAARFSTATAGSPSRRHPRAAGARIGRYAPQGMTLGITDVCWSACQRCAARDAGVPSSVQRARATAPPPAPAASSCRSWRHADRAYAADVGSSPAAGRARASVTITSQNSLAHRGRGGDLVRARSA